MSNVNRTRREFMEMIAQDNVDVVNNRLVNIFKTFVGRPNALEKVKEAIAAIEDRVGITNTY